MTKTRYAFLLSQDYPALAAQEVLALSTKDTAHKTYNNLLITDNRSIPVRLALTRKTYKVLFVCKNKNLRQRLKNFNWQKVYKSSFSLTITDTTSKPHKLKTTDLAKFIWRKVKHPKVNIKHAKTKIHIIQTEHFTFITLLQHENDEDFKTRHPKTLPARHPTTLQPKLARAMVNLTGTKKGFLDPFCGAGGLLIESALMHLNTCGSDIDPIMLRRARINLKHLRLKATLKQQDATTLTDLSHVATDLPYGRNSSISDDTEILYKKFLDQLKHNLKHRAVLIFPSFIDHRRLIRRSGLNLLHETNIFVHKSLSRNLVILTR